VTHGNRQASRRNNSFIPVGDKVGV